MKITITLTLLAISQAHVIKPECDLVTINNISHEKEVLKGNINNPYQMAIDYNNKKLFFSYSVPRPKNENDVFNAAYLNLMTNEYIDIPGIIGGFATAVDNKKQKVYLGGKNGIYEYNYVTNKATHVNPKGFSVWQLFVKDTLYYTAYPQERVYSFEDGISKLVPELENTMVQLVGLDNNNNIYFSNSSGLFCLNNSDKKIVSFGEYTINSFTADISGNLYFSTPHGFYNIDNSQQVNKLADVDDVFGLVVDGENNFIYAVGDKIIRLRPTTKQCLNNV